MTTVVLVRHGRSTANSAGILAGRSPGVDLDETGFRQARELADRLAGTEPTRLISSPLERCRQTLEPLADRLGLPIGIDDRFIEADYGDWTGRPLADLAAEPLWRVVQSQPSLAVFPGGEGLADLAARVTAGLRDLVRAAGPSDVLVICSHGDVIAALLADALGLHHDGFQRLGVAPASVSVIRCTPGRTFVLRMGDDGPLGSLRPPMAKKDDSDEASASGETAGRTTGIAAGDAIVGGDPGTTTPPGAGRPDAPGA